MLTLMATNAGVSRNDELYAVSSDPKISDNGNTISIIVTNTADQKPIG